MHKRAERASQLKIHTIFIVSLLVLILAQVTVMAIFSNVKQIPSGGRIAVLSPLHTEGRYILDIAGNPVYLRGINYESLNYAPNGWWVPEGRTQFMGFDEWNEEAIRANLQGIRSLGCNVIRFHFALQWWLDDTSDYRNHLRDIAAWAQQLGLYVVYDLADVFGDSFPWPPMPYEPWAPGSPVDETGFVQFWRDFAVDLGRYSNVVFEIYNEPHDIPLEEWQRVHQRCIDAIRESSENLIVVQYEYGLDYYSFPYSVGMSWVWDYPLDGSNLVYSTHIYRHHDHLGSPWDYGRPVGYNETKQRLVELGVLEVHAQDIGPIFIGETGAWQWSEATEEREWFTNFLAIMNEWNMSYAGFEWFTESRGYGMLQSDYYIPPPTATGAILRDSIAAAAA